MTTLNKITPIGLVVVLSLAAASTFGDIIANGSFEDVDRLGRGPSYGLPIWDYDLARVLLSRWHELKPDDGKGTAARIRVEMASEAYPKALRLIDLLLAVDSKNAWAIELSKQAIIRIEQLNQSKGKIATQ
jgi:hypothetical protein